MDTVAVTQVNILNNHLHNKLSMAYLKVLSKNASNITRDMGFHLRGISRNYVHQEPHSICQPNYKNL